MRKSLVVSKIISNMLLLCLLPLAAVAQSQSSPHFPFGFGMKLAGDGLRVRGTGTTDYKLLLPVNDYTFHIDVPPLNLRDSERTDVLRWLETATPSTDQTNEIAVEQSTAASLVSNVGMPAWIDQDFPLRAGSYIVSLEAAAVSGCSTSEIKILVNGLQLGSSFFASGTPANFTSTESFDVATDSINVVRIESAADSDACVINVEDIRFTSVISPPKNVTGVLIINSITQGNPGASLAAATVAGAPTIGTATRGNASATVAFTPPTSDGGSVITTYTATSTPATLTKTCTASCSSITVTGLANGTAYTFKVKATNAIGTSSSSAASNSVTPSATLPGVPTIGIASAGNAQVTITFTAPTINGGSAITSYTATSAFGSKTGTCSAPCTSITVTGLTNGTAYAFVIKATNANGASASSVASNSVTPAAAPGAPTIGTATAGNASATVTFTPPASSGGSVITSYTATSVVGGNTGTCSAPCTSISVTGLTNGTAYTFIVKATNAIGTGAASAASNSVTPSAPATVPGAPIIGTASAGNASATVTFTAPASNGGSAITSYTATSIVGGKTGTCTAPCTSISVTGLTNGTAYTFTVKATNVIGAGAASAASNSVTPSVAATVPGAPTIGTATAGNASATVNFTAPASNGGSTITSYTATSTPGGLTGTCTAPCTSISVTGLTNGTPYTFTVKAINAIGTGAASASSNSVTPNVVLTVPGAPNVGAATAGNSSATVSFTAPASDGGSAITIFTATSTPGGVSGTCASPCTSIVVTGLTNGTAYTLKVSATNAIGMGALSAASNSVTPGLLTQTISGFAPTTPITYSTGSTFTISATGGISGNAVIFATTTPVICRVNINIVGVFQAGTCTLTANQAGNGTYSAAPQVTRSVIINKEGQTITFAPLPDVSVLLGAISMEATASSGLNVTFTSSTTAVCTVSATTVDLLTSGTCTIAANQSGSTNISAAPQVSQSFNVTPAPLAQTITGFVVPATPLSFVTAGTFSITATPGASGNPIIFGSASSAICSVAGNVVTMLTTGACALTADQAGNATYDPATQLVAQVTIEPSGGVPTLARLIASTLPAATFGQPYSGVLVVSGSRSVTSVTVNGLPAGMSAAHNGNGTVRLSGTPTASGNFALTINATNAAGTAALITTLSVNAFVNTVVSLSAGGRHTCVVFNGGVRCWGENSFGQLGDNTTTDRQAAVVAIGANNGASSVAAGEGHTCAVVSGGVQCWGANSNGKLGNGTVVNSIVPTVAIPSASNVTGVAVSGGHSCAVVSGGVRCWGANESGQLGNGTTSASSSIPVIAIADGSGATAVAAGEKHTCAVVSGGVQCWGLNSNSELGIPFSTTPSSVPITAIAPGSGVTAISAGNSYIGVDGGGRSHTCVMRGDGVECWGNNAWYKLGSYQTGTEIRYAIPTGGNATAVSAGGQHTCAVVAGGVKCWGLNDYGQLGSGNHAETPFFSITVYDAIPAGSNVTAISAGTQHTCVIVNGGVECWGYNFGIASRPGPGRLGGATGPIQYSSPVSAIPGGSGVLSLAANGMRICALMNIGLHCWGSPFAPYINIVTTPTLVSWTGQAVAGAALGGQLCAIINNSVRCGNNFTPDAPVSFPPSGHLSGVTAGRQHACVLANGGVQCWGDNSYGQLGDNTTNSSPSPVTTIIAASSATAIAASDLHSCAIVNGGVQCWGSNVSGQLGNNSVATTLVPVTSIMSGSGATAVAAGTRHTCAIINGGVQCWGDNSTGQLGIGAAANSLVPSQTIPAGSNVTAIAADDRHSCAVVNGGVQCWGANDVGQLGNGTFTVYPSVVSTPVTAIPAGSNVIGIAVGYNFSCAVLNGGAVCWGSNTSGQLASPATTIDQKVFSIVTNSAVPSAPVITATAFDSTSITLTFTPPANGGSAITGYLAKCTTQFRPPYDLLVQYAAGNASTVTITGLLTGATYTCNMNATNMIGTGPTSNTVTVTPISPATPPTVALILPPGFESGYLAQSSVINLGVSAQAVVGTLTLLELFEGATLLTSFTPPAGTTSYTSPTYAWTNASLGIHTLTVKATNSQGTTASKATGVQVLVPSTITLTTASNFFFAPATIELANVVTPASGTQVFRLEIFANNGVTNTKIHSNISGNFPPPYNFSWLNVAAGNYALTTVISDRQGLVITSAPVNVTVVNNVSIQIVAPLNGSTVNGDAVLVSGTAITPANSAVTVNGQLATLSANG